MLTALFLIGGVLVFTEAVKIQLKKGETTAKAMVFALAGSTLIGFGFYFL